MGRVPKIPDPPVRPEGFWQYSPAQYPKHICKYPARPARQKRIPARIPGGIFWQWNSRGIPQNFKIYSIKFAKNIPQFFCCPPNFLVVPNYCIFRGTIHWFWLKGNNFGLQIVYLWYYSMVKIPRSTPGNQKWNTRPAREKNLKYPTRAIPGNFKKWNTRPARYPGNHYPTHHYLER